MKEILYSLLAPTLTFTMYFPSVSKVLRHFRKFVRNRANMMDNWMADLRQAWGNSLMFECHAQCMGFGK